MLLSKNKLLDRLVSRKFVINACCQAVVVSCAMTKASGLEADAAQLELAEGYSLCYRCISQIISGPSGKAPAVTVFEGGMLR